MGKTEAHAKRFAKSFVLQTEVHVGPSPMGTTEAHVKRFEKSFVHQTEVHVGPRQSERPKITPNDLQNRLYFQILDWIHMTAKEKSKYTPEEYLEIERGAEDKSEYFNGETFAMAGASRKHNLISGNIFAGIHGQVRNRDCEVYSFPEK